MAVRRCLQALALLTPPAYFEVVTLQAALATEVDRGHLKSHVTALLQDGVCERRCRDRVPEDC